MKSGKFAIIFFIAFCIPSSETFGMSGSLRKVEFHNHYAVAPTTQPLIAVVFGYLENVFEKQLLKFIRESYEEGLKKAFPNARIIIVPKATSEKMAEILENPHTFGIILVGHTFKPNAKTPHAAFLMYSRNPDYLESLPENFLSQATSAVRFIAFFGCHGPDLVSHYKVVDSLRNLPGSHEFYYNQETRLRGSRTVISLFKQLLHALPSDSKGQ